MPQATQVGLVACTMNKYEPLALGDVAQPDMIVPLSILAHTSMACMALTLSVSWFLSLSVTKI
jgi:hypothetical protein